MVFLKKLEMKMNFKKLYKLQQSKNRFKDPTKLVDLVQEIIDKL